jgi:hypothetical protein
MEVCRIAGIGKFICKESTSKGINSSSPFVDVAGSVSEHLVRS